MITINIRNNRCVNCMEHLSQSVLCSKCGYDNSQINIVDARALIPGTLLFSGRYLIGRIIYANGEGFSYLSYDEQMQQKVVVKEFFPDTLAYRNKNDVNVHIDTNNNFQYKTLKIDFLDLNTKLLNFSDLKNIVPIYNTFEENNTAYAIQGYLEDAIPLKSLLTQLGGSLSVDQSIALFKPIFDTVLSLHLSNVIHRGISTETILIDKNANLFLTAFDTDASRTADSEISHEFFSGYSAPEQYNMSEWQGTWTDVYSLCAVMYTTITGVVPQSADDRMISDKLLPATKIDNNIPKNISYALSKGMIVNPEHRTDNLDTILNEIFYNDSTKMGSTKMVNLNAEISPNATKKIGNTASKNKLRKAKKSTIPYMIGSAFITTTILLVLMSFFIRQYEAVPDVIQPNSDSDTNVSSTVVETSEPLNSEYTMPNFVNSYVERIYLDRGINDYFVLDNTSKEYSETIPDGKIISQDIEVGTTIKKGTVLSLNIVVSKGQQEWPDFSNYPLSDVEQFFKEEGIIYKVAEAFNDGVEKGKVIRVERGATAIILVSKGKEVSSSESSNGQGTQSNEHGQPLDDDGIPIGPIVRD